MNMIGIDLGGTNISAGRVSKKEIEELVSVKTKASAPEDEVIEQITSSIDKLINEDTKGIGIAVPAIVDVENGVVFETVNIPSWKEVHLKKILEDKYKIPVYVNNDANCFALGEKYYGQGKDAKNMVALTIGTGLGAGIIIDGKLHSGQNCGAGEFGEIVFKDYNLERYCSGQYFQEEHKQTGEELVEKAKRGDKEALRIFSKFGEHLGKALSMVVHSVDPELIVLGGSVAKSHEFFKDAMHKSLKESIYKRSYSRLKIKQSTIPNVTVLGAAALHLNAVEKGPVEHRRL